MSADELSRAVDLLVRQVGHWQPPRWAAPATAGNAVPVAGEAVPVAGEAASGTAAASADNATRAEVVHRLVQQIADLAAAAEGQPRRRVPRLDNDLALPDQLRVVAADLVVAGAPEPVLAAVAEQVIATRRRL